MTEPATPPSASAGTSRTGASATPKAKFSLVQEIKDWIKFLAVFVPLWLAFTTVAFALYRIPSESMVPALEVGDRVLTNKFAYGYSRFSLPLGLGAALPSSDERLFGQMPRRGDVVVFAHPANGRTLIKRVIGLPGDRLSMWEGRVTVNGVPAAYTDAGQVRRYAFAEEPSQRGWETVTAEIEDLPDGARHRIHDAVRGNDKDTMAEIRVLPGHVFVMGDNRDRSQDSRFPAQLGQVPIENIIGRADTVLFTLRFPWDSRTATDQQRLLRPLADYSNTARTPATGSSLP